MRYDYSMLCLASVLPDSEGLRATVRLHIKDLWLGAADLPEYHPWMIQVYAIFAVSGDASFRFIEPELNRRSIACWAIDTSEIGIHHIHMDNLPRCARLGCFVTF